MKLGGSELEVCSSPCVAIEIVVTGTAGAVAAAAAATAADVDSVLLLQRLAPPPLLQKLLLLLLLLPLQVPLLLSLPLPLPLPPPLQLPLLLHTSVLLCCTRGKLSRQARRKQAPLTMTISLSRRCTPDSLSCPFWSLSVSIGMQKSPCTMITASHQ